MLTLQTIKIVVTTSLTLSASSVQVLPEAVNLEDQDTALWQFSCVAGSNLCLHFSQSPENRIRLNL